MHGRHHINRQVDGWRTGRRICDIRAVDECAALSAASALEIAEINVNWTFFMMRLAFPTVGTSEKP